MNKVVFFAFSGNKMGINHIFLNVLDLREKEIDARVVIEGEAVTLIREFEESNNPLYKEVKDKGLIDSICKGCSEKLGVLEYNETVGIPITGSMKGHPPMEPYISDGYQVITL